MPELRVSGHHACYQEHYGRPRGSGSSAPMRACPLLVALRLHPSNRRLELAEGTEWGGILGCVLLAALRCCFTHPPSSRCCRWQPGSGIRGGRAGGAGRRGLPGSRPPSPRPSSLIQQRERPGRLEIHSSELWGVSAGGSKIRGWWGEAASGGVGGGAGG